MIPIQAPYNDFHLEQDCSLKILLGKTGSRLCAGFFLFGTNNYKKTKNPYEKN